MPGKKKQIGDKNNIGILTSKWKNKITQERPKGLSFIQQEDGEAY